MTSIKRGDTGTQVRDLQIALNRNGYGLATDGQFGQRTELALKDFQLKKGLDATGIADAKTQQVLGMVSPGAALETSGAPYGFKLDLLPPTEYVNVDTRKFGVSLHHTAGVGDPHRVKSSWDGDDRGRVCTHYVVGGHGEYDGLILQLIPLEKSSRHIALSRMGFPQSYSDAMNDGLIGIEICNYGYLKLEGGKFVNAYGGVMPADQVVKLDKPWRGFEYWHAYTEKQVAAVRWLLNYLAKKMNFKYEQLPLDASWLDLSWDAMKGKRVLTTHSNFEFGKFDCSPQPRFFEMVAGAEKFGSGTY